MSISVQGISKLYGEQKALDNVSFEVGAGEVVGFLGPNGAGKSTMMKIITCFLPPSNGEVFVCGESIFEDTVKVRSNIGYLPEHNPLYLDMYVKEYLRFVAELHKIKQAKKTVEAIIERVGLTREQKKKIGALSKGYRQRVGLAQAMIHDPAVLILDEPTSGLDPNQLVEIRNLIKEIGSDKTVMLSTHIMQEVEALCDRVIIINQGHIVANEQASNLNNLIRSKSQIQVEFDQEVALQQLQGIAGVDRVTALGDKTFSIEAASGKDLRPAISKWAVEHDLLVLSMQKQELSMEEIFKELTAS